MIDLRVMSSRMHMSLFQRVWSSWNRKHHHNLHIMSKLSTMIYWKWCIQIQLKPIIQVLNALKVIVSVDRTLTINRRCVTIRSRFHIVINVKNRFLLTFSSRKTSFCSYKTILVKEMVLNNGIHLKHPLMRWLNVHLKINILVVNAINVNPSWLQNNAFGHYQSSWLSCFHASDMILKS